MTFEPWTDGSYLLRLEHIFEENEDPIYSKPVKINLKDTFKSLDFDTFTETNLAANQWIGDVNRMKFKSSDNQKELELVDNNLDSGRGITGVEIITRSGRGTLGIPSVEEVFVNYRGGEIREPYVRIKSGKEAKYRDDFDVSIKPMEIRTFVLSKFT